MLIDGEEAKLCRRIRWILDPMLQKYLYTFNHIFYVEEKMKWVLKNLVSTPPILITAYSVRCPNLMSEFDQYKHLEYEWAERLPALVTEDEIDEERNFQCQGRERSKLIVKRLCSFRGNWEETKDFWFFECKRFRYLPPQEFHF